MKLIRLMILAGLAFGLLPHYALADDPGRPCVFDPTEGFQAPNGSGACFGDEGFQLNIFNEDDGVVLAANAPGADNQWFRRNPNGKGKFHAVVDVSFLVYCSPETIAANACNPLSGQGFEGTGTVKINAAIDEALVFDCPATARIKGSAMDGFGNAVNLSAALTLVPDDELGCRATISRIDATPIVD